MKDKKMDRYQLPYAEPRVGAFAYYSVESQEPNGAYVTHEETKSRAKAMKALRDALQEYDNVFVQEYYESTEEAGYEPGQVCVSVHDYNGDLEIEVE